MMAAAQTYNWSGDGTSSNPYRIADMEFSSDSSAVSLLFSNTDVYFELFRNSFKGDYTSSSAIVLTNVQNAVLDTNYIDNFLGGIVVSNSNNIRISNNTITKNSNNGIETFSSNNIVIEYNNITSIEKNAIEIMNSDDVKIFGNKISDIMGKGIFTFNTESKNYGISIVLNDILNVGFDGINVDKTDKSKVIENIVGYSGNQGISLEIGSSDNEVFDNIVYGTRVYGLSIDMDTSSNYIANNIFVNNCDGCFSQGATGGFNNTIEFNYWHDWTSPDIDNDLIVDEPYPLSRSSDELQFDYFPKIILDVCNVVENRNICENNNITSTSISRSTVTTIKHEGPTTSELTSTRNEESSTSITLPISIAFAIIGLAILSVVRSLKRKNLR